jgi:ribose-phosphate pyrophosphokinase
MSHTPENSNNVLIFASETPESCKLADQICYHLGVNRSMCEVRRFNDDESQPQFKVSVSNRICVVITSLYQTTERNSNDSFMVLLQMCNALFTSQAKEIIIMSPYTPYARQDKPDDKRSCITSGLFARLIKSSCDDVPVRYITFDLHAGQLSTVFQVAGIRTDNLHSEAHMVTYIKEVILKELGTTTDNIVVVAPDAGAVKRAKRVARDETGLDCGHAHMDKTRSKAGVVDAVAMVGDVKNKYAIVVDDMCDTGGTLCQAALKLKEEGALGVIVMICHGVFSKNALDRLQTCDDINLIVTTNTCDKSYILSDPITKGKHENVTYQYLKTHPKIHMIDISWLAAEAIRRRIGKESLSEVFDMDFTSQKHMDYVMRKIRSSSPSSTSSDDEKPNLLEMTYNSSSSM